MPQGDEEPEDKTVFQQVYSFLDSSLNFYRLHILYLCVVCPCLFMTAPSLTTFLDSTFTPLIFSGIFYACNGRFHITYIDALYNSVSAMAVCGLASVDLSSLTGWQQVILFIQMCIGNPVCKHFELLADAMNCNYDIGPDFMGRGLF
jgi:Trk-type K+ transport system membrane component